MAKMKKSDRKYLRKWRRQDRKVRGEISLWQHILILLGVKK